MRDINTRFDAPHSRYNEITRTQLDAAGLTVLVESPEAGVHFAVSPDGFRTVYFQGHPEYHAVSLLKEYKREVFRWLHGELEEPPPYPEHYFSDDAKKIATAFVAACDKADRNVARIPEFPETDLSQHVHNTWSDTGKAMVNNWLGLVYQLTNRDRKLQFMPGIDPDNPLQIGGVSR